MRENGPSVVQNLHRRYLSLHFYHHTFSDSSLRFFSSITSCAVCSCSPQGSLGSLCSDCTCPSDFSSDASALDPDSVPSVSRAVTNTSSGCIACASPSSC